MRRGTRVANSGGMSHPARLSSTNYAGYSRCFATACTYKRAPVFRDAPSVSVVAEQFMQAAETEGCEVLAYCFMPDHVHLLVAGTSAHADFRRFMKLAKQRSGWRHSQATGKRLWQPGYHDRVMRDDEATPDMIRYIVSNPLRAGLVNTVSEYPFWGSAEYSRAEILSFLSEHRSRR